VAINLPDLPQAVRAYLDTKVNVTVELRPDNGPIVNQGEGCHILVNVRNASAGDGGIALTNVRYQVSVKDPTLAKFFVPGQSAGTAIDEHGQPLAAGALVGFFNWNPSDPDQSYLRIGEDTSPGIRFNGKVGAGAAGFTVLISARILADPDLNALFPRNENSTWGTTAVDVVA
jgi:hypothetical protein